MKLIYVTLNDNKEAEAIGQKLLKQKLANCVNFFPITCIYNYEDKITQEPEIVMLIKTVDDKYDEVKNLIQSELKYDNFIGQIKVEKVNENFEKWLCSVVK
ncbi:divalent-cation tolerance protein CutA [Candidatus Dojkabacteria bacterium]|nr:divalent-cation tolerance protein CutA [Candidatus Dojkabacteria bacterium]